MSDFPDFTNEVKAESQAEAKGPVKVRRVSHVRVRKQEVVEAAPGPRVESEARQTAGDPSALPSAPERDTASEWEGSEPETVGGSASSPESAKRKRKRRRGKGGGASAEESVASPAVIHRTKFDPGQLAKSAWKIYLSEVSEEGVALVGDHDARDLARRCFRLAEIFLEEQEKRCGAVSSGVD